VKGATTMGEIIILDDYRKKVETLELEDLRRRVDEAMLDAGICSNDSSGMTPEYTYVTLDDLDTSSIPLSTDLTSWTVPISLYSSYGYYSLKDDDGS
jgi:hypothetical protein